jgi:hypothetical protein
MKNETQIGNQRVRDRNYQFSALCREPDTLWPVIQMICRTRHPKKPTVIDPGLGNLVGTRPSRSNNQQQSSEALMSSRNKTMRACERLQSAAPISDDASLVKLKEDVAELLRKAKCQGALATDELVSTLVGEVARKYFQHILQKQARDAPPASERA